MTSLAAFPYACHVREISRPLWPAFEKVFSPHIGLDEPSCDEDARLEISVVFTSIKATLHALRKAGEMADDLNARIVLVFPQIVPFPLPLTSPPVWLDFRESFLRAIAAKSQVETTVRICLCRDREEALSMVLKPRSLVVLGSRKRWWPTAERRLAKKLRRCGHEVIISDVE